ncbi:MAG: DegT/DnrJ/EryC1/StrS family aminotransferase [Candidatus Omnitrophica bacterium]|nr:DegT/DnrJ/EryC1/StrS family aminotransferase [Candidatus Omnitrophota bacterium]
MGTKISQLGINIEPRDIVTALFPYLGDSRQRFTMKLSEYLGSQYVYLVNSGTTALYLILNALKRISLKREVVIPAYTAPVVVLPIIKSGLKPVLCDISLRDFNMDIELLPGILGDQTLCIIPTHMFGVAVNGISRLRGAFGGVYIVEDCAQSLGSKLGETHLGKFSDIAFSSFNRGKNLPTYGGGCIFTDSKRLAGLLDEGVNKLKEQNAAYRFRLPFELAAFAMAVRPFVFGSLYPLISHFKDNRVPDDFVSARLTAFQAGVGASLLERIERLSDARMRNAESLTNGLRGIERIIIPEIPPDVRYAINRLPVAFKDLKDKNNAIKTLNRAGIDTSVMYGRPIHHIFDLGCNKEDFKNASYAAERILTLPTHSLVQGKNIDDMVSAIKGVCSR